MTTDEPAPARKPTPLPEGKGEEERQSTPNPSLKGGEQNLRNSVTSGELEVTPRAFPPLPKGSGVGGVSPPRLLHVLVLLTLFGLWTWKLLQERPVPEAISAQLTEDERFGAAKSLHAVGYGTLTVLAVMLPVPNYWRWFFVGLLALHGAATEIAQTYIPGRTGRVMDVVIDWAGIILGVLIWQVQQARRRPEVYSPRADTSP